MGMSGAGIFDDDIAKDIRASFEGMLAKGQTVAKATRKILVDYAEELEEHDAGAVIYLALASLQLEHGGVEHPIKAGTLSIIDSGQGLERWEEGGPEVLAQRKQVLQSLRERLASA